MGLLTAVALAAVTQAAPSSIFVQNTIQAPGPDGPLVGTMLAHADPAARLVLLPDTNHVLKSG